MIPIRLHPRHWIRLLICWLTGHLWVTAKSVFWLESAFMDPKTEAVCLRCMKQIHPLHDQVDMFFAETPFQKKMRERAEAAEAERGQHYEV